MPEKFIATTDSEIPNDNFSKVAIIGLGYVGLPLAIQFARSGYSVLGFDIDQTKVDSINASKTYIKHISSGKILEQLQAGKLQVTTNFSRIIEVDAVLICVPTPLTIHREPDLSFVLDTGKSIAPYLRRNTLVVLESTTYPGTTDTDLRKVLEEGSGMKAGKDFNLAYSPEREDPGNPDSKVAEIPKVIGGYTENCTLRAENLYSKAIEKTVLVSSCRAAEATKLMENIFRSVNIALVNELKQVFAAMDIDIWEVIEAAKTKPFGFMPFYPGPGLGGHCIPIDPFYLTWKAREYGQSTRFIELAGEVNTDMPDYVVNRITEALNAQGKPVNGSRILVIGLAYKANVDDDRESPTYIFLDKFKELGADTSYFDPYFSKIGLTRQHSQWAGICSVEWNKENIASFDVALISTAHDMINWRELADWVPLIIDTRNAMHGINAKPGQVWKA